MRRWTLTSFVLSILMLLGGCIFGGSTVVPGEETSADAGTDTQSDTSTVDLDFPDATTPDIGTDFPDDLVTSDIPLLLVVNDSGPVSFCDDSICTLTGALELAVIGFAEDQIVRTITFDFSEPTEIELLDPIDLTAPVEIVGTVETPIALTAIGLPAPAMRLKGGSRVDTIALFGGGEGFGFEVNESGTILFNVRVSGFNTAVKVSGTDHVIDDCVLGDNPVNGLAPTQVALEIDGDSERILIQNNDIRRADVGVAITPQTRVPLSPIELVSNRIFRNQTGVRVNREYIDFVQNSFFGNQAVGVELDITAPLDADSTDRDVAFEGNAFGGDKESSTLEGNGVGLDVIRAPAVLIGGVAQPGCTGVCNLFVDNRSQPAFIRNVAHLRIQGNYVGALPTAEPAPNALAFRIEYTNLEPADFLIGRENVADLSRCVGACNVFGASDTSALTIEGVQKGSVSGNHFGWVSAGVSPIPGTAILLISSQGTSIGSNFITASVRGIQVTGSSSDLTRKGSISANLIGGSPEQPCSSLNENETLSSGILLNNGGANGVGNWDIELNDVRCVENIGIQIAESSLPAPVTLTSNKLGLGPIGGSGIVVSVPDVTVVGNQIANVGGNGVVATGAFATNTVINANIFGRIDGTDIPTPVLNNDGNAVGVFTGANQIQISNNQIIGGYQRGFRGANSDSSFVHFGNVFRQGLPRFVSIGGADPVSSPDYESDQDIGANTSLNAPITVPNVLPVSGTVSVNGGEVTAYKLENAIWSEYANGGSCQTSGISFSCSGVMNGDVVKLMQTADLFHVDLMNFGNGDYVFTFDGTPLTVAQVSAGSLEDVAEAIVGAAKGRDLLVNHNCSPSSLQCRLWFPVEPGSTFTVGANTAFGVPEYRGRISSPLVDAF